MHGTALHQGGAAGTLCAHGWRPPTMVAWPKGLRTAGSEAAATNRQTQATTSPTPAAVAPPEDPQSE